MSNSLFVINPYWDGGAWVFDEPRLDLYREPFVAGIPDMIDKVVEDIPNAHDGFSMIFSEFEFPGHGYQLAWEGEEAGGNWYSGEIKGELHSGWLCPALFKYFDEAPIHLYISVSELGE